MNILAIVEDEALRTKGMESGQISLLLFVPLVFLAPFLRFQKYHVNMFYNGKDCHIGAQHLLDFDSRILNRSMRECVCSLHLTIIFISF